LITYFAEILLPLAVPNLFTYRVPQNMSAFLKVGMRVVVPLRGQKLFTGVVASLHQNAPKDYQAKYIDTILDEFPVVHPIQLRFWDWMAEYYMCTRGEVLLAALPIGLRLSSETKFTINPAFDGDVSYLNRKEMDLLDAIALREVVQVDEVADIMGLKTVQPTLKKLLEVGAILVMEDLKERYKPKVESYVRLTDACEDEAGLESAFKLLERAPKQQEVLMLFVQMSQRYGPEREEVKKSLLQKQSGCTPGVIQSLEKKGVFEVYQQEVGRLVKFDGDVNADIALSEIQKNAIDSLRQSLAEKPVVLLHGVTSSGKTEIYTRLIQETLEQGKQVLYILPEIALTTQMIQRLQGYFGDKVAVYHSRFGQNERVEIWNLVLKNDPSKARVLLGARSAVFLPFSNLGLVIVDEEHETSFKQYDPAPRYHARDAAIVLAAIHGAKTVLGSATPSFESMYNAIKGKYGYVSITERYGGMQLPDIKAVPLNSKTAPSGYFTETLLDAIKETLALKEQVILFQNRRGYAPVLVCQMCGWSPECTRCDVTATYHKAQDRLVCHYCGSRYNMPPSCPACGSHKLKLAGFGTERIEEELPVFFPDAKIARLDLDSTRSKFAYQNILSDFQDGDIDILIGTQMVTKGLDFGRVSLVGILNADLLLKFPEFRSTERGFQLMTQVAGRSGRRKKRGTVIIQTHDPSQWVIQQVIHGNYKEVFESEMADRRKFGYPPYSRLILLVFRHKQLELVDYCAARYHQELLNFFPERNLLGPEYPHVSRVNNRYNKHIIIKIDSSYKLTEIKERLTLLNHSFFATKEFRSVRLIINVDPQ
jgi:primosomal protein N' (replication factor Y)